MYIFSPSLPRPPNLVWRVVLDLEVPHAFDL